MLVQKSFELVLVVPHRQLESFRQNVLVLLGERQAVQRIHGDLCEHAEKKLKRLLPRPHTVGSSIQVVGGWWWYKHLVTITIRGYFLC